MVEISTKMPIRRLRPLRRSALPVSTIKLARYLIGKTLVRELPRGRLAGRIVETEAYLTGDAAAHTFRGPTPRNRSLYLERGHAYVYFTYGNHYMLNVSGGHDGTGEGVLIRAVEPIEGIELMENHRRTKSLKDLARGPGRLAAAFRVDRRLDGVDLTVRGPLWIGTAVRSTAATGESVRIGITKEVHRLLRFYETGSAFVSGPKSLNPRV
jgi:DNA-3-methyladenine glycosylase